MLTVKNLKVEPPLLKNLIVCPLDLIQLYEMHPDPWILDCWIIILITCKTNPTRSLPWWYGIWIKYQATDIVACTYHKVQINVFTTHLCSNLVSTLARLQVDNLTHDEFLKNVSVSGGSHVDVRSRVPPGCLACLAQRSCWSIRKF